MSAKISIHRARDFDVAPVRTAASAKARLLAWAEDHDARKVAARSNLGTIAVGGCLSLLAGLTIARILSPHRSAILRSARAAAPPDRGLRWPGQVLRAGVVLAPLAIKAAQDHAMPRTPH